MALFDTDEKNLSYALGMNMSEYLSHLPLKIDTEVFSQAFRDRTAGSFRLDHEQYARFMKLFQKQVGEASARELEEAGRENLRAGTEFLKTNAKKDGVHTTASGLQYQVLHEGSGGKPSASDTVRVHYTGTLIDGRIFDSSVQRGEPAEFGVGQVIRGWTEALQLMTVGSKYKLFIPANLAYGEQGAGEVIGPHATLIFEVELLDII